MMTRWSSSLARVRWGSGSEGLVRLLPNYIVRSAWEGSVSYSIGATPVKESKIENGSACIRARCTHTHVRAHAHILACARTLAHTHTRTHMHAHTRRHTHAHAHSQRPPMIFISRMGPTSMARASITNTRCGSWEGVPERGHRSCRRGERASIRAHAAHAGTRAAAPAPEVSRAAQRRMAMVSGAPSLRNMAACLFGQRASSGGVPLRAACLFGRRASSGMLSRCCTLTTVANGTYLGERHGRVHAAVVLPYQHAIPAHCGTCTRLPRSVTCCN